MTLLRDRSKKWARERIISGENFTTAKEVITLGFLPGRSLLFALAQVVTANIKTRSVQDQITLPCKSVSHQPQKQTALPLNYPGQWWCLERFSTMTWKQSIILTGKLNLCDMMVCRWNTRFFWLGSWSSNPNFLHPQIHYTFPFPWGITGFLHSHFYNSFFECFW